MNRRSFAHTERPAGAPPPAHRTKALDAISSLSQRGSANIQAEQLRKPVTGSVGQQPKPPSPVALEAISRMRPQQGMPQMQTPMLQMPQHQPYPATSSYGQPPIQPNSAIQPLPRDMQPPQQEMQPLQQPQQQAQDQFEMPPVPGYWGQKLREVVAQDPRLQKEWQPVIERFAQIRASLDTIRDRVYQYKRGMANA